MNLWHVAGCVLAGALITFLATAVVARAIANAERGVAHMYPTDRPDGSDPIDRELRDLLKGLGR